MEDLMGVSEKIKILLLKRKKSQKELAEILGMSAENLNNKLRRESFGVEELETIGEALGAKYTRTEYFTLTDTGEEI
jgi:transcriptional regulator with XRE-family HTH domain